MGEIMGKLINVDGDKYLYRTTDDIAKETKTTTYLKQKSFATNE
jgi:hypothetical protein